MPRRLRAQSPGELPAKVGVLVSERRQLSASVDRLRHTADSLLRDVQAAEAEVGRVFILPSRQFLGFMCVGEGGG